MLISIFVYFSIYEDNICKFKIRYFDIVSLCEGKKIRLINVIIK